MCQRRPACRLVYFHNVTSHSLFNANVEYAIRLQDCMANAESGDSKFHGEGREPRTGSLGTFMDSFQWYWEIKIAPKLCRVAAVFFGLLSLVIIVSECTLSFTNTYDTIVFQFFKNIFSGTYTQTMVRLPLTPSYRFAH